MYIPGSHEAKQSSRMKFGRELVLKKIIDPSAKMPDDD